MLCSFVVQQYNRRKIGCVHTTMFDTLIIACAYSAPIYILLVGIFYIFFNELEKPISSAMAFLLATVVSATALPGTYAFGATFLKPLMVVELSCVYGNEEGR